MIKDVPSKSLILESSTDYKQSQTYLQIKNDILNNTYPAGTLMVERKLCEIYNVSRSPIRNALQKLSHEGLLSFSPGKGVIVSEFSIEDILEVYDLIELLQVFAIKRCINKINTVALETLLDILEKMNNSLLKNDIAKAVERDQRFHSFIIDFAGNKRLINAYENLNNQSMRFQASTLEDKDLAKRSYEDHMNIYKAIENKDLKAAENLILLHYHNIKQYYLSKIISI